MASPNARVDSIRIRLSPDMMARSQVLAESFGMPISTLAAFAMAEFVQKHENNARLARMAVMDSMRNSFSPADLEKSIVAALPAIAKALGQENLALDDAAPSQGA